MPRIRSVHPDICKSEKMAQVSAELERTFIRLWTHCDDEGRCEDRPKLIKAALYPEHDEMTPERVERELDELAAHGLIVRYESGGVRYLQVRSWGEYQHPQKPRPSKYPTPHGGLQAESRTGIGGLQAESRTGIGLELGVGVRSTEIGEGDKPSSPPSESDDRFEKFWKQYPKSPNGKKPDKPAARRVWRNLSQHKRALVMAAVEHYAAACESGTYAKHAHRWLRDGTFEDWETPAAKASSNGRTAYEPYRNFSEKDYEEASI